MLLIVFVAHRELAGAFFRGAGLHAALCLLCYQCRSMPSRNIYTEAIFVLSNFISSLAMFPTVVYDLLAATLM